MRENKAAAPGRSTVMSLYDEARRRAPSSCGRRCRRPLRCCPWLRGASSASLDSGLGFHLDSFVLFTDATVSPLAAHGLGLVSEWSWQSSGGRLPPAFTRVLVLMTLAPSAIKRDGCVGGGSRFSALSRMLPAPYGVRWPPAFTLLLVFIASSSLSANATAIEGGAHGVAQAGSACRPRRRPGVKW